jgi:uncharacterized membrane protein/nitrite reductase/ring-hydroxylating ferredoxin subunit
LLFINHKTLQTMRSKLHLKGHPIHPILVAFPIAFFIGALVFDALGYLQHNTKLWQTGSYLGLAGVIAALVAAVPGIVDYFGVVPPASSAKKRAAKHGVLNIVLVVLFALVWLYRQNEAAAPLVILGAEVLGVVMLGISGWLGGTLVHRNQIGIDHRYAEAGKWKEKYIDHREEAVEVAGTDELKIDQMMLVHVGGKRIVVGRTEQGYVAFDDRCTHRGGTLADGVLICGTVQCPWHGSQFDVATGAVKAGPAKTPIQTYELRQAEGKLYLIR